MQGVQSARQTSPRTETRLAGSKTASSPKAPKENAEDFEYGIDLKSLRTPINLYEDECAFCHSFRTTLFHGPMVRYIEGRIVSTDRTNLSNGGIYVHEKCLQWSPEVWYEGDTVRNVESELHRASGLKCHKCGLEGAALGCYYKGCKKTFHVPCAVQTYDCRWDVDNLHVLCPKHVSQVLPCDNLSSQTEGNQFSSLPQSCHSDEEGISNACQGKEMKVDQQGTPSNSSDKLVLLGSSLSASEKDSLEGFARWTEAMVANEWGENVTHVIVGKNAGRAWSRSYEVLMAILFGKWVVRAEWFVNSLEMHPDREDRYEVRSKDDSDRPLDGPKIGRTRAVEGAPKLFSGLLFCLSEYMSPDNRGCMRNIIAAAGGRELERRSSLDWRWEHGDSPPRPYFVYGGAPAEWSEDSLRKETTEAREHAAAGVRVISHLTVMHAVAAYDVEVLDDGFLCQ